MVVNVIFFSVTGLSLWGSVIAVSLVCIFYTALVCIVNTFYIAKVLSGLSKERQFLSKYKTLRAVHSLFALMQDKEIPLDWII